jgi:O-antigen/teichoic acid export membrane protein
VITPVRALLFRHREFVGNVATLVSGKSAAAVIGLLATPVVSRLFEPIHFGVAAAFVATASIVSDVASLRYETAIVLPKDEEEALAVRTLAFRVLWIVCFAALFVIAAAKTADLETPLLSMLGSWVWLLPVAILLTTAVNIQQGWLTRSRSFKTISSSLVLGTITNSGTRIGAGAWFGSSVWPLIAGDIFGSIVKFMFQRSAADYVVQARGEKAGWKALMNLAREYSDFPRLNAPATFILSLGNQLPILLFGTMFSPVAAGLYAMAHRLTKRPTAILSYSIRRVFLQKVAAISNRGGSLRKAYLLATGGLVMAGIGPLLILSFFGQPILGWLLGDRWLEAGRYLEIMAPWMFMIWVMAPTNPVFVVLRKQKLWLMLTILHTFFRLGAFGLAEFIDADVYWTLRAYVFTTIMGNVLTAAVALSLIAKQEKATHS